MNNKQTTVTIEFLRSKLISGFSQWAKHEVEYNSQSTNIHRLSDSVFEFTEYNFLPVNADDVLDGHFTLFVNKDTFQYLIYKSSDYGSFTYVREVEFKGFLSANDLPEVSKAHIESIIAHKLLTSYFYDGDHINHKGDLLFPRGENDKESYVHRSLICDNRGYIWSDTKPEVYSDVELKALNILCGFVQPDVKDFNTEFVKEFCKKFKRTKGKIQVQPLEINGEIYQVVHKISEVYGKETFLVKGNCVVKDARHIVADKVICNEYLDHKLSDFVKIIPIVLKNIA